MKDGKREYDQDDLYFDRTCKKYKIKDQLHQFYEYGRHFNR